MPEFREGASLDAQPLPTLCPACVQHFPSTLGGHAGTEPMSTLTLEVARLKSSFHDFGSGNDQWVKGGAILWTPWQPVNRVRLWTWSGSDALLPDQEDK